MAHQQKSCQMLVSAAMEGAYFVSYLGRSEGDLGGHKSRDLFRRAVREAFIYINSINFDLMTLLRELLKIL
jgi:hypothetical protein